MAGGFCERKGVAENVELLLVVMRRPDGVAQRQVRERESGNPDLVDDVACRAEDQRGQSGGLEPSRGQTDRLVADRSKRNQHGKIDVIFAECVEHVVGPADRSTLAVQGGDPSETPGDRTDDTVVGKATKMGERQE